MKVAILCLFALVAVSQAAFTVNLIQQTQPVLAKTFAQARFQLRTRSDGSSELQTTLFQNIMASITGVIDEIQSGVSLTLTQIGNYYNILTQALSDLQAVGGEALSIGVGIIQDAISSLFGGKQRIDFSLSGLAELVGSWVAQLDVPHLIQNALESIYNNEIVQQVLALVFGNGRRGLFGDLFGNLSGAASGLVQQIAGVVNQIQAAIAGGVGEVVSMIHTAVANAQAQAVELTQEAAAAFIAAIKPLAVQLGDKYQEIVAAIQGLVGNKF